MSLTKKNWMCSIVYISSAACLCTDYHSYEDPVIEEGLHYQNSTRNSTVLCGRASAQVPWASLHVAKARPFRKLSAKSRLGDLFQKYWSLGIPSDIVNPKWFRIQECLFVCQPKFLGYRMDERLECWQIHCKSPQCKWWNCLLDIEIKRQEEIFRVLFCSSLMMYARANLHFEKCAEEI
jgi:hypothetical protein